MTGYLEENPRTFLEFLKLTCIVSGVQLTIFFFCLAFYHFCIFKRKLSREIELIRLQAEKLERITKGEPEPEQLSPTQKSSLLEAEPTQKSEEEKVEKKKKQAKKTKPTEKKKEKKKENKKKTIRKTGSSNQRLSLENTQMDEFDTGVAEVPILPFNPLQSPPTQDSCYDNDSVRQEKSLPKVVSDPDQTRTCSSLNEKSVYSPRYSVKQERTMEQADDADMKTARDDLWY